MAHVTTRHKFNLAVCVNWIRPRYEATDFARAHIVGVVGGEISCNSSLQGLIDSVSTVLRMYENKVRICKSG
jgi:hypothetical protein